MVGENRSNATLILGGARSGKSQFAENMARNSSIEKIYLATATLHDDEMTKRVALHRQTRSNDGWRTIEEPLQISDVLDRFSRDSDTVILIDCLTLWLTNLMMEKMDVEQEFSKLETALTSCNARVLLVSNEVGLGIVPENKMAREFRDHAGKLHQRLGAIAREVYFIAAGLPLQMK